MPYLEHKLPDGTRLIEHYENDVVVGTTRIGQLPTGMTRSRRLDAAGTLVEEIHFYGTMLDFSVTTKYLDGRPAEETYFRKRRLITRSAYLKARAAFSDMPAPSEGLPDLAAEVGALVSWERRQKQAKARGHTANPERATRLDEFCRQLLSTGLSRIWASGFWPHGQRWESGIAAPVAISFAESIEMAQREHGPATSRRIRQASLVLVIWSCSFQRMSYRACGCWHSWPDLHDSKDSTAIPTMARNSAI